jgi:squalene-hopene/tetraprenyl-beta-curcumene cyclase
MSTPITEVQSQAQVKLELACEHLLCLQHEDGWWKGELQTNVTMDAEDMLLREFLHIRRADETERSAAQIRSQQRPDGTWANFYGAPGELSTTIEAYWALRLAGDQPESEHMQSAARFIRENGGLQKARVFTHLWMALFGLWPWERVPALPVEIILLPSWVPLNVYDFACWARQTIVALAVVMAHRPCRELPFDLRELNGPEPWRPAIAGSARGRWLSRLDRLLKAYERRPLRPLRALALARAERWIVRRQEADGSWGGIQPPWVYSLLSLHLLGYDLKHPVIARGLAGLDRFTIWEETPDGPVRRLEACQSPVWDTVLAMVALADAGVEPDHEAMVAAGRWVLDEEIRGPGDWQVQRPWLAPGGWAFEFDNDGYPDVDDTAEVVLALRRAGGPSAESIGRAVDWLIGMQCRDGGWGAFDADNSKRLVTRLPFCDFGEVIDPPSADVTAHTIEALAAVGLGSSRAVRRGVVWLLKAQEEDGSWFGRWGANYLYGTGAVVPALIEAGVPPTKPVIRRAVGWLISRQNADGGWGEDLRSYKDQSSWSGRGESTASQTAWALLALLAAGGDDGMASAARGVEWLAATQREDGTWDEPQFTGTGFPGDFYINYHLYRLVFPVCALGRYVEATR